MNIAKSRPFRAVARILLPSALAGGLGLAHLSPDPALGAGTDAEAGAEVSTAATAPSSTTAAVSASSLQVMPSGSLTSMTHNYLLEQAKRAWEARDRRIAAIDTSAELSSHAAWVRSRILARIGGLPSAGPSLNVRFNGTLDRDGYKVDKLIYESQANFHVTANLYRPETGSAPYPAVLGIPGHASDGTGKAFADYQKVWIALAKRGFVILVIDPFGQGERFEHWDAANNKALAGRSGSGEHTVAVTKMYLTGTNPVRWMVHDVMRGIDYLRTRSDVDKARIAVIGNSGGGVETSWVAALDGRVTAAGPSSSFNEFEAMWQGARGLNDGEENLLGFVGDGLSQADLYAGFAPKPLKVFAATKDYNPIAGTRAAFEEVRTRFYGTLGAASKAELFEYNDEHGWTKPRREKTVEWLERILKNNTVTYSEPDPFPTEPPQNLRATPNGQIHDTGGPGGATTHSLNYAIATSLHNGRTAAGLTAGDLRNLVRTRLDMGTWSGLPTATAKGTVTATGYRIDKLALATEAGITVPALAFVPTGTSGRRPGVLYLNTAGKAADATSDTGPIAKLARSRRIVLAIDARVWGESAYPACTGYSCGNHEMAVRSLMLGRNLVGMQTRDALRALDYLAARPDVDPANLAVIGKTNAGVHALLTAFLDTRVKKVHLTRAPASYLKIAGTQRPGEVMDVVIGKVLADYDLPDLQNVLGTRVTRSTATSPDYVAWLASSPYPIP